MAPASPSPRLLHLLSRLSDDSLKPEEASELDDLLLHDADARAYYRCHAAVHVALGDQAEVSKVVAFPVIPVARKWPAFAAAAALVLAAGTTWWSLSNGTSNPASIAVTKAEVIEGPVLAVTSAADDVQWNLPGTPASGQKLRSGPVKVISGRLSLSLAGGQTVHLQGPAEFELIHEGEIALRSGPAAFRTIGSRSPFIVHLPKGALVGTGSEFSAQVEPEGTTEVRVFANSLNASTVGSSGRTLEDLELTAGQSILINSRLSPGNRPVGSFLRIPPTPPPVSPASEQAYAAAVVASSPATYWRFETVDGERQVPDEMGLATLKLNGEARLSGNDQRRYLEINDRDASGFALPVIGIPGLDTARGLTVECLLYSSSENYGTAVAFELVGPGPSSPVAGVSHAPQTFALERMGRKGENIGHVHPDFALRAMFRSPAGYSGGTNLYSLESHLLHRWIHVVVVHDGTRILLYLNGELSDSNETSLQFNNVSLRPIIGRLQPSPKGEHRQWIGGIDEVALFSRTLSAEEIRAHVTALKGTP
jgi:ferric-dicitrate binding protein FerR (iron transport regulator)